MTYINQWALVFFLSWSFPCFGQLEDDDNPGYDSEEIFEYDGSKSMGILNNIRPEVRMGFAYQSDSRIYRRLLNEFLKGKKGARSHITIAGGINQFNLNPLDFHFYLGLTADQTQNKESWLTINHEQILLTFEQRITWSHIWPGGTLLIGSGGGLIIKDEVTVSTNIGSQVFEEEKINSDSFFLQMGATHSISRKWSAVGMMYISNIKSGMLLLGVSYGA